MAIRRRTKRRALESTLHLPPFEELVKNARGAKYALTLLSLDPGSTTGYSYFSSSRLRYAGQVPGTPRYIEALLKKLKPDVVVYEQYRIYPWKTKQHSLSTVPVARLIGQIELLCDQAHVPYVSQMAMQAKGFATDAKLKKWGLYQVGRPHATDAIRHAVYALLFQKSPIFAS